MASNPEITDSYSQYVALEGTYDEMCTAKGELREHWTYLIEALRSLGPAEIQARRREATHLLRDDGVTYNIYGDPHGLNRPWALDLVPQLISSEEWAQIEAGLLERAELLSLLLTDIYGPRNVIKKGLVPPELVYAHRGFLRACDQDCLPKDNPLVLYAADVVRRADGAMWVLGDRTQAPSGAGYALENRTVMSRVMPSVFRESHVHRLAFFFRTLRTRLAELAPEEADDPRIVLLTPGPHNETYFEHVYLANYLGYTLVQGSDLTVRDGRVWLKSLGGLEPVDVIWRRVDGHFCDPLELRADSRLGVAGLLEMVRRGTVAVANPIGASALENPGLIPFLPRLAKHFLGHELRLPSAATWWCGQARERDHVLANLHKLVIRPIHRTLDSRLVFGAMLSQAERNALRSRIRAHPHLYIGQEQLSFSTAPVLINGSLAPRRAILRAYLAGTKDSFVVMPGGLTRVAAKPESLMVSNQLGAVSKDTWVLASEPEKRESLWPTSSMTPVDLSGRESLPSRTADDLFWMGRYAERAEQAIRLLRSVFARFNDTAQSGDPIANQCLTVLLRALTHVTVTYPGFVGERDEWELQQTQAQLQDLVLNLERPGTLASTLAAFMEAAYAVRDRVSADTWRVVNAIDEELGRLDVARLDLVGLQQALDRLITGLMALTGLTTESMARALGWHFLDCGRRIERGLQLGALARAALVPVQAKAVEGLVLESVLDAAESLVAYRRRYRSPMDMSTVLDLIMQDETNPRSLVYQITAINGHISTLPQRGRRARSRGHKLSLEASTLLALADTHELAAVPPESGVRGPLDQLLARLDHLLKEISTALTESYFSHVEGPYQLVDTQAEDGET